MKKESLGGTFDCKPLSVSVSAIAGDLASSVIKVPQELIAQQHQINPNKANAASQKIG